MPAVTIKDIARLLNVSASTVSRALKGSPEIGRETVERVQETARQLNYRPNKAALSLLQARTRTIGLIVPNLGYHFFASALQGVEDEARERGYTVIACQSLEAAEKEVRNVEDMRRSGVDGILISLAQHTRDLGHLKELQGQMPVVMFDRVSDALSCSRVFVNNVSAAFGAVEHLVKAGCRRLAYLAGPADMMISNHRMEGFRMAVARHSRKVTDARVVHTEFDHVTAMRSAMAILRRKDGPDGIFAVSDRVAIGAMEAARKLGIAIPDELAIVGFNDEPIASLISPSLSSVRQPALEMGRMSARLLIDQIEAGDGFRPVIRTYMTRLIVRASSRRGSKPAKT
jgi:LacI family transcriptional regulator